MPIDLQCNGAGGIDLTREPERLWEVGGACCPAWASRVAADHLLVAARPGRTGVGDAAAASRLGPPGDVAEPLGLHLEGPFLNPAHRGAHPTKALALPDRNGPPAWSRDGGVAMVTLAPELPGALELTRALVDRGVVVCRRLTRGRRWPRWTPAADAGVSMVTHLFNGMVGLHHREPGVVGALAERRAAAASASSATASTPSPPRWRLAWRLLGDRLRRGHRRRRHPRRRRRRAAAGRRVRSPAPASAWTAPSRNLVDVHRLHAGGAAARTSSRPRRLQPRRNGNAQGNVLRRKLSGQRPR